MFTSAFSSVCVNAPQQIFFVRKTGDYVGEAIVFGKIDSLEVSHHLRQD